MKQQRQQLTIIDRLNMIMLRFLNFHLPKYPKMFSCKSIISSQHTDRLNVGDITSLQGIIIVSNYKSSPPCYTADDGMHFFKSNNYSLIILQFGN